jgi:hypothetical protein
VVALCDDDDAIDGDAARFVGPSGRLRVRIPQHIGRAWLEVALPIAPVEAIVLRTGRGQGVLFGLLPGRAHAAVRAPMAIAASHVSIDASEGIELSSRAASVALDAAGQVRIRGEEVLSRAAGTNRIKGGAVRIN